jgi:hypothetical protein
VVDQLTDELDTLHDQLARLARRQPGCQALDALYGIGSVTAVAIWAELGDVRRPLLLAARGPPQRPGRHRLQLRRQAQPRPPGPPGPAGAALGAVGGRPVRSPGPAPPTTPTPPTSRTGWAATGPRSASPQAHPPLLPHAARAGRPGAGGGPDRRTGSGLIMLAVRALPTRLMRRGPLPHRSCRHLVAGPERTSGLWVPKPVQLMRHGHIRGSAHRVDRAVRPVRLPPQWAIPQVPAVAEGCANSNVVGELRLRTEPGPR